MSTPFAFDGSLHPNVVRWKEDEHKFRTELAASLATLVDELEVAESGRL